VVSLKKRSVLLALSRFSRVSLPFFGSRCLFLRPFPDLGISFSFA
jgi:hypothetical protein